MSCTEISVNQHPAANSLRSFLIITMKFQILTPINSFIYKLAVTESNHSRDLQLLSVLKKKRAMVTERGRGNVEGRPVIIAFLCKLIKMELFTAPKPCW